jgi:hypothetical protein
MKRDTKQQQHNIKTKQQKITLTTNNRYKTTIIQHKDKTIENNSDNQQQI